MKLLAALLRAREKNNIKEEMTKGKEFGILQTLY
jgi:hypothetical protein